MAETMAPALKVISRTRKAMIKVMALCGWMSPGCVTVK